MRSSTVVHRYLSLAHGFHETGRTAAVLALLLLLSGGWWLSPSALAAEQRSIELILDASGSMNGRLADGTIKLTAAKSAVRRLAEQLGPDIRLAYRVYGNQSPPAAKNCDDTQLLVDFGPAQSVRAQVIGHTDQLRAQGYTPITRVIGLAAEDLKKQSAGERIVVLVSDGKETCQGDPCDTARKLKQADAGLVVHTVGFGVDDATRFQLQCIAGETGGSYYGAASADELAAQLGKASVAALEESTIKIARKPGPGKLQIKRAGLLGHNVLDAESGRKIAAISQFQTVVELPAGIYNVTFGKGVWKSVAVRAAETTVLDPGELVIENPDLLGHRVLDSETGAEITTLNTSLPRATLIPSTFDVTFNDAVWRGVTVKSGETKVLKPGVIKVSGANATVHDAQGKVLARLSAVKSQASLPPGDYTVKVEGQTVPVKLEAGKAVNLKIE